MTYAIEIIKNNIDILTAIFLGFSAYSDIRFKKIPNLWFLIFLVTGIYIYRMPFVITFILSSVSLFVFYLCGFFGAGDIKLISILCAFVGVRQLLIITFLGFLFAAIYSLCYLISKKLLISRLSYFINYSHFVFTSKRIIKYKEFSSGTEFMPVAHWILIGYVIWRFIELWIIMH